MATDPEIKAMEDLTAALGSLDEETRARVLRWAGERFKVAVVKEGGRDRARDERRDASRDANGGEQDGSFAHIGDLYDAADPSTDSERMLVAGYWFQVLQGETELDSQTLNKELKHLGHGVNHTAQALVPLMDEAPRLVIQLKKEGSTRQARKKFKLTGEGIKKVKAMLRKAPE